MKTKKTASGPGRSTRLWTEQEKVALQSLQTTYAENGRLDWARAERENGKAWRTLTERHSLPRIRSFLYSSRGKLPEGSAQQQPRSRRPVRGVQAGALNGGVEDVFVQRPKQVCEHASEIKTGEVCGCPLPCPFHTVVIDTQSVPAIVKIPVTSDALRGGAAMRRKILAKVTAALQSIVTPG